MTNLNIKHAPIIVMTLLVRDEEDIIKENIDFHLSQGVDFFIATDNKSVDSTPDILKEYERLGVLTYILETDDDYNQHKWVTRMARMAYSEYNADWVINNDADEFWWPKSGNLSQTFQCLPAQFNILEAQRHNFVPINLSNNSPYYSQMIYREKVSLNSLGQKLPSKVAHRGNGEIIVSQGNHSVKNIEQRINSDGLIEILHFPIRTYKQFENKIIKGGAAYNRNEDLAKSVGLTWRELYKEYNEKQGLHDYYKGHCFNDDGIKGAVSERLLIKDRRLSRYLMELYSL